MKKIYMIFLVALIFCISCKKATIEFDCSQFKEAMFNNDVDLTKKIVNAAVAKLPDQTYSADNLSALVEHLRSCFLTVDLNCFNCLYTAPPQSRIALSFSHGPGMLYHSILVHRTIELSNDGNGKIVCVGVHN